MPLRFRKALIAILTFIGGLYFFIVYFIPLPEEINGRSTQAIHEQIMLGVMIVGNMAIGLGIINLLMVHGTVLLKGGKRKSFSAALLLGLCVTFVVEIGDFIESERANNSWKRIQALSIYAQIIEPDPAQAAARRANLLRKVEEMEELSQGTEDYLSLAQATDSQIAHEAQQLSSTLRTLRESLQVNPDQPISEVEIGLVNKLTPLAQRISTWNYEHTDWKRSASIIKNGFFVPLGASMFALLAFYIASAAYRSFRIRSIEAVLMMSAAILVILGQIPHGPLYISDALPELRKWLLDNVSTPAFRAITFAAMIAGLSMAVRMWLSLERSSVGDDATGRGNK